MKRKLSFLLLYATLVLFGGLGALLLLWGEKEPHASLTENRMLAGFPAFSLTSVRDGSFMSGLEDFLSDNMFDRDRIVTGVSRLMSGLSLGQTDEADVDEALFEQVQSFAQGSEPDPDPVPAAPSATAAPIVTPEPSFPAPVEVRIAEATPAPPEPASPAETDAAEPASTESPASVPTEVPAEKDLSAVPKCVLTLTQRNGTKEVRYEFSKANVQRMIRLLNAYRAVLPEDGHVFFTQPPFPGIAANLSSGEYVGWDNSVRIRSESCSAACLRFSRN